MPNPFTKGWNYVKSSLDKSIDDNADPKILVHQAMNAARAQHQTISDSAAKVIGNARQLEASISSTAASIDKVNGQIRQTLLAADAARADDDHQRATTLDSQAESLATKLTQLEAELSHNRQLHQQASQAATEAKAAVTDSERRLREILAQEDQLLLQAAQAQMESTSVQALSPSHGSASPTLDEIRAKIEGRYASALGTQELAEAQSNGATAQRDAEALTRQGQGQARLEQIRQQMAADSSDAPQSAPGSTSSHPTLPRDTRDSSSEAPSADSP